MERGGDFPGASGKRVYRGHDHSAAICPPQAVYEEKPGDSTLRDGARQADAKRLGRDAHPGGRQASESLPQREHPGILAPGPLLVYGSRCY